MNDSSNNPVLDAIARRYSCRSYTGDPVDAADIRAVALAGVQAPSSRGNAPWVIVAVTDQELITDLSQSALRLISRHEPSAAAHFDSLGTTLFYNAPVVYLIAARHTWDYTSEDLDVGLAVQNMTLAATALGLGSVICGFVTQAFRDVKGADAARLYDRAGLAPEFEVRVGMAMGHPASDGQPHTPDLTAVTYID
ncbi:MAG: nitroreductase family protein [Propionibacteriaceae bacterium]|jgi:nitroreductase|nr:nitroreductase family protein [Propionibacteriaceae bacterium]